MEKNPIKVKAGKAGALAAWGKRWQIIDELRKLTDKEELDCLVKMKTKELDIIYRRFIASKVHGRS